MSSTTLAPQAPAATLPALRVPPIARQAAVFLLVGAVTSVAYAAVYLGFRGVTTAAIANAIAFLGTGMLNTAAHRRFTFPSGRPATWREQAEAGVTLTLGVIITSGAVALLPASVSAATETVTVVAANVAAAVTHFLLLRVWVFGGE